MTSTKTRKTTTSDTSAADAQVEKFLSSFADAVAGGTSTELDVRIAFSEISDVEIRNTAAGNAVQAAATSGALPATWQPLFESLGQKITADPALVLARQLATIEMVRSALIDAANVNYSEMTVARANGAIIAGSVSADENVAARVSVALARLAGRKTTNEAGTRGRRYDSNLVPAGTSAAAAHVDAYLLANTLKMDEVVTAATLAASVCEGSPYVFANPSPGAIADYLSGKNHGGTPAAGISGSRGWCGERDGSTVQLRITSQKTARTAMAAAPTFGRGRKSAN